MASGRVCESGIGIEIVDSFRLVNVVQTHMIGKICIYYIHMAPKGPTYPLRLGGHADELLARIPARSIGDLLPLLGLQLLDEITLQADGAITIVHLTLDEEGDWTRGY